MADNKFKDSDYKAMLELNSTGMVVTSPKDKAMRKAQRASALLREALHGNINSVATDAMRERGINIGFDKPAGPMDAAEKMKNGVARNSGKTKNQLFGGK